MRAISVIFRRELAAYLHSPLGWVVAAVTLLVEGLLFYTGALKPQTGAHFSAEVLAAFFYTFSGLIVIAALALSVRLFAEERQTRTIALLRTSPVNDWQMVLGKFFAAFAFLGGITLASFYMPVLVMVNGRISVGQIVVGYVGLLLIGAAVLAIGLFSTSLTKSYLVAAAVGGAVTGAMFLFQPLAAAMDPPLSAIFSALNLHYDNFRGFQIGILQLKNVVYYCGVTYFFLLLSVKVLEAKRWE
jgi:ABC-2 type transport system permease protein